MAISITRNASTGNILITENGKPAIRLCNHGATVITNNDAQTHIIITTNNYDGHLLLSDITTIDGHSDGPFALNTALGYLDEIFKK